MRSPGLRQRLIVFAILSAVAVIWTGAKYARVTEYVLPSTYTVGVDLASSGGIFTGAEVTYRGVAVGRVGAVGLTTDGVRADLLVDKDVEIPADVDAHVHNRSAVGEQYIDLVPRSGTGPRLADGDVIVASRTIIPLGEEVLVKNLDDLASSVPLDDLRTVVSELGQGFGGSGEDLGKLIDGSDQLVRSATDSLPATLSLLDSGTTVMRTQVRQASDLQEFAQGLSAFSSAVRTGDADLRRLLDVTPGAAQELTSLTRELGRVLPDLLANLIVIGRIQATHLPHLEQFLVAFPWAVPGTVAGARHGRAMFVLQTDGEHPVCSQGYIPSSKWRSVHDSSYAAPDHSLQCTEPGAVQRGSRYAPGPTN